MHAKVSCIYMKYLVTIAATKTRTNVGVKEELALHPSESQQDAVQSFWPSQNFKASQSAFVEHDLVTVSPILTFKQRSEIDNLQSLLLSLQLPFELEHW